MICIHHNDCWHSLLFDNALVSDIIQSGVNAIMYRDSYCASLSKSFGYETEMDGNKAYACNMFMFGCGKIGIERENVSVGGGNDK